jgi:outer membrane protein assembly factor BamE (lipoprotein component of BamABCDE complex)
MKGIHVKTKTLFLSVALATAALGGCAALDHRTGTEVTDSQLGNFKKGKTRQSDVIAAVGQPSQKSMHKGREVWTYDFTLVAAMPWAKNRSEATVFEFDDKGVLMDAYRTGGRPGKSGNPMLDAAGM